MKAVERIFHLFIDVVTNAACWENTRNHSLSLLFSQHLAGTLIESAVYYCIDERERNYQLRKMQTLSWSIITLNTYTIVTIQWILEIIIPRF